MAKSWRRYLGMVLFGAFTVFIVTAGLVEGSGGVNTLVMVLSSLLALVLIFGVEIDEIRYGDLEITFNHRSDEAADDEEAAAERTAATDPSGNSPAED